MNLNSVQESNDEYISIDMLMGAFAHPETIKVIGENNDTATSSRNED